VILLDTSAWVHLLGRGAGSTLPPSIPKDKVAVCLPIVQELLQGIRDDLVCRRMGEALAEFPWVEDPLTRPVVLEAVDLYRRARRGGLTPRSGVDCLVAVCALRNDLEVVHRDRDFEVLARVSSLRQRSLGD
jgi:predicted nucleic acid-binding protein